MKYIRKEFTSIFCHKRINICKSKNDNFHLSIRVKNGVIEEDEIEKIIEDSNNVYENVSDNDSYFNQIYSPNVRLISKVKIF